MEECCENFMKKRTLRVAVGDTLSNEATIENGVVQGAVLMSEKRNGIEEPVKIMVYADDWMILTSHKYVRTSENRILKALHQITKWADNTGFQISTEKPNLYSLAGKGTNQQTDRQ
jgi:hypothetical protein